MAAALPPRPTVLVLDDDDLLRTLVTRILTASGFRVLPARDPAEAFAAAERHDARIDLVLSDLILPHARGTDVVARLSRCSPRTRAIFMSGHPGLVDGAPFLLKPFAPDALVAKVREILYGDANADSPEAALGLAQGTDPELTPITLT